MKRILLNILGLVFSAMLFSQTKYAGKVVDEEGEPIPFVNVMLLAEPDSLFVAGTITDSQGAYRVEAVGQSDYLLRFSALGYETIYSRAKEGPVILSAVAYGLDEVSVAGKRPVYRMKGTGFVTDVGNSLLKNIGSANDVLKQLPGVRGNDGKFEVFGKGAATIYINDRLVRDDAELERLSSDDIASVELIHTPGANYDADVRAVLKIKTKRKIEGFASRLRLRGSQNHCFSDLEQLNLSYAAEKYHWYGNLYHNAPRSQVDGRNRHSIHTPDTFYKLSTHMMDWDQRAHYYTLESGIGVNIHPAHEIGTSYTYQYAQDRYEGGDEETLRANEELVDELSNDSYSDNKYHQHAVNLYYMGKIQNKLDINLNADYVNRNAKNRGVVRECGLSDERTVTSSNNSIYNLYAAELVLTYPLGKGSLEGGVDYSYMDYDQEYLNKENYLPEGWFTSKEQKIAGFVNYAGKVGSLGWSAGVRYEYFNSR